MNAAPRRRGWCPSLYDPMETGDGLLVRVKPPAAGLASAAARALADAAERFGNGVVELTRRGNLQVRGLSPNGVAGFASAMVAAGLADPAGQLTANLQNQVQGALNSNDPAAVRDSIVDYVRSSASGDQAAQNAARDRAVNALARTANITPEEARTRIDQLQTQYREAAAQAEQKARAAAETARSATSRASLLGVLALVLGAVASWFGGMSGVPRREMTATTTTARV